jgi:hypothetical protein
MTTNKIAFVIQNQEGETRAKVIFDRRKEGVMRRNKVSHQSSNIDWPATEEGRYNMRNSNHKICYGLLPGS